MSPVQPMSAMPEREWSEAWAAEQERYDHLRSRRGSWLPNVVEPRVWGAIRWTSGRPGHAGETGQAAAATFVVVNPERADLRDAAATELRDPAPIASLGGFAVRRQTAVGAAVGGAIGMLLGVLLVVLISPPFLLGGIVVLVLAVLGVVGGVVSPQLRAEARSRAAADHSDARTITGRYAPAAWTRLVVAATLLEMPANARICAGLDGDLEPQTAQAVHHALWEAAGLLLGSSDHTGVEILAEGVERLADAHRL